MTERTGNTLSVAAGLSTSSTRNFGDFGGVSKVMSSRGTGSPASVRFGLSTFAEDVPDAEVPSLNMVEASACPLSSSDAPPASLDRPTLSCSVDITALSSGRSIAVPARIPAGSSQSQRQERVMGAQCVLSPGICSHLLQCSHQKLLSPFKLMDLKAL
jgi:hypothetical protein